MKIRKSTLSDESDVKALWGYCFEPPTDPFFQWYFKELAKPEEILVGENQGNIACDLHRRPYDLSIRGLRYPVDYIVGVATHPAARMRGYAKELIRGEFHLALKEDKPFVILMPSAASFYLPMGFGFYAHQWERSAAPEKLAALGRRADSCRTLTSSNDWKDLASIYREYTKKRNGWAYRDEVSWEKHIDAQLLEGYIAVTYDRKGPSGYLFYTLDDRKLIASEMAFKNEAGRKALYAFMAGHQGSVDTCVWYEPLDDHSFRYWQDGAEHTYIKNRTFPFMLGRVIDPVIAFDGLPCSKEIKGEIAFQLIDSFLPENSGIYVLRAEDGRIHALKEDVFYDLKCHIEDISGLRLGSVPDPVFSIDAGSLAELFMGAADLSELVEAERATILLSDDEAAEKAVDLAVAMLPRERNWINEWF